MPNEQKILQNAINLMFKYYKDTEMITHCLRVMSKMDTTEEMSVAVLHDIFDNTDIEINDAIEAVGKETIKPIIEILYQVPRGGVEIYKKYIADIRKSNNKTAIKVKIADIKDVISLEKKRIKHQLIRHFHTSEQEKKAKQKHKLKIAFYNDIIKELKSA